MKRFTVLCCCAFIFFLPISIFAQITTSGPKTSRPGKTNLIKPKSTSSPKPAAKNETTAKDEKEALSNALAQTDLAEKIKALKKFTVDFPKSTERIHALEVMVSTQAQIGDEKLRFSETESGIQFFKDAVNDVPTPVSEKLFAEVLLQFPTNLFYRGQQDAAIDIAKLIEDKVKDNPKQLLGLATFYLGTEKPEEAKRLAEAAIGINNSMAAPQENVAAYQTLGIANRLDLQLEDAAKAYTEALKLNPDSVVSKRSLADMERALGRTDEALTLYRELTEKDANDMAAQNGLILSLFDSGKQTEAEAALNKSLEANPNNLFLLVGAAYWYAGHKDGEKTIDFARKAIAVEPRYTWAYIALAHGLLLQKNPLEAEKNLLAARQYGNFPTLDYELATMRLEAGFFEEAANELKKRFEVKDGVIATNLAGRVRKEAKDFVELLDLERRASLFEPTTADNPENSEKLKSLLNFSQELDSKETDEIKLNKAVDEFVQGNDNMRMHRQLFAANRLLQERKNLPKVLELTQTAVKGVDDSLNVSSPAAAVLADELFESRTLAISRGEVIIVPDIPKLTLSNIVRGRIEEIAGWALFQQDKTPEAIIRLKRAVLIVPEKSAWWRSSVWKLGVAYETSGNAKEALYNYVKCYTNSQPDAFKWSTIEAVYRKINGNTDGLDKLIGAKPEGPETVAQISPTPEATPNIPAVGPTPGSTPAVEPSPAASPTASVEPTPTASPTPAPTETPTIETATPTPTPAKIGKTETTAEIKISPSPTPISTPEAKIETTPSPTVEPTPISTPQIKPTDTPSPTVKPTPEIKTDNPPTATKSENVAKNTGTKSLFDPIIITVPNSEVTKPANTDKPAETNTDKSSKKSDTGNSDEKSTEEKPAEKPVEKSDSPIEKSDPPSNEKTSEKSDKPSNETVADISRPRLVKDNQTSETPASDLPSCLVASQDSISILSEGGNLGILIGYADDGDVSKIKYEPNSPKDIAVSLEPDIGKQSNRAFFVIKSISANRGVFTVTFTSPCGKKEILVKVR